MTTLLAYVFVLIGFYFFSGLIFSILFIIKMVGQMDEHAKGTGIGFRLLIVPGTIALWPVLLNKWRKTRNMTESEERSYHD
ncbi:MAG: hypothetical protein MI975_04105 [Cytophagales bacterium]|nr:hypothetical protein [Cytophagales bacterium]